MAFDYKKEYREFYLPKSKPEIVLVPPMNFVAVRGRGDPNGEDGAYQRALSLLYGVAYTVKMSYKGDRRIDGYFDYVVPPLEGLWWIPGLEGMDYARKGELEWISMIRLPDFVKKADFDWAAGEAARKKKMDFSGVEFFTYDEGLCVQCMHEGPFDQEPATVERMAQYAREQGCRSDFTDSRLHHEIYLTDVRKSAPEKWRTVVRHPVAK